MSHGPERSTSRFVDFSRPTCVSSGEIPRAISTGPRSRSNLRRCRMREASFRFAFLVDALATARYFDGTDSELLRSRERRVCNATDRGTEPEPNVEADRRWTVELMAGLKDQLGIYDRTRVLLFGHTGFVGGWLALWLHRLGAEVHGFALPPQDDPNLVHALDRGQRGARRAADDR